MTAAETIIGVVFACVGGLVALFAAYQLTLAVAAFFYRPADRDPARAASPPKLLVLIPAHDEAALIERCVRSLDEQTYPRDLYRVVVVADNCTDDTAARAAAAGAAVLVRDEPEHPGKGQALRWATDRLLAADDAPDAVAVVDADSTAVPGFLASLAGPMTDGAQAAQGESILVPDASTASQLRAAAFFLVNRVRPAGRAMLGLPCSLAGNGMLLTRELLEVHPWGAFTATEDVEYAAQLRLAGIGVRFAGGAVVLSATAPNPAAAAQQQLRWERGKLTVARRYVPKLLAGAFRRRAPGLLDSAFELCVPPLGTLTALAASGAAATAVLVALGVAPGWSLTPWLVALAAIPLYVLVGLRAARAPAWAYRSLVRAPWLVLSKATTLPAVLRSRDDRWVRTQRPGE